jgi:hypothetical protein
LEFTGVELPRGLSLSGRRVVLGAKRQIGDVARRAIAMVKGFFRPTIAVDRIPTEQKEFDLEMGWMGIGHDWGKEHALLQE